LTPRTLLLTRGLLVLASLCVVGAFALAVLYPPMMRLDRFIAMMDHGLLLRMQDWVRDAWGDWVWQRVFVAVLVRPAWLVPLCLAVVFAGLAVTASTTRRVPGSPHFKN
jgi:hypothetical protein